jgi:hypothetical protein
MFKECYIMEKVHGTSAHIRWKDGTITYFSGGASRDMFIKLFDEALLVPAFTALGLDDVTVFGEAYGGKEQGMRDTYGPDLRFIAFDVKIGDSFVDVPVMDGIAGQRLGLDVVPWFKSECNVETLDRHRDAPSIVASVRGMGPDKLREGIVVRPLVELRTNNGERVMAKHKGEAFSERIHTPKVRPDKLEVMTEANKIADEWVTTNRLKNVLSHLPSDPGLEMTGKIIQIMQEDVEREAAGEIEWTKDVKNAVGRKAATIFRLWVTSVRV